MAEAIQRREIGRGEWESIARLAARYSDLADAERDLEQFERLRAAGGSRTAAVVAPRSTRELLELRRAKVLSAEECRRFLGLEEAVRPSRWKAGLDSQEEPTPVVPSPGAEIVSLHTDVGHVRDRVPSDVDLELEETPGLSHRIRLWLRDVLAELDEVLPRIFWATTWRPTMLVLAIIAAIALHGWRLYACLAGLAILVGLGARAGLWRHLGPPGRAWRLGLAMLLLTGLGPQLPVVAGMLLIVVLLTTAVGEGVLTVLLDGVAARESVRAVRT